MNKLLKGLGAKHRFRDPIYGYIFLTEAEREIIDTPLFQRLRRVHQLALTKYVYPTAEHSRFVHSLGVVQSATDMFLGIHDHVLTNIIPDGEFFHLLKLLRFAALLHDIGHMPFSHAAESEWLGGLKHEDFSQFIIRKYPPISNILDQSDAINIVSSLLSKTFKPQHRILNEVISGQLDADRADYLLRDSYCCGVKYGEFDFVRYVQIFGANGNRKEFALTVEERDIYMVEAFLMARYHYNLQVPFHRTRSGFDICLRQFLAGIDDYKDFFDVEDGKLVKVDFDRFEFLDDYSLFERFKIESRNGNLWAKRLLRADHLRVVLDTTDQRPADVDLFKSFRLALRKNSNFVENVNCFVQNSKIEVTKIKTILDQDDDNCDVPKSGTIWVNGLDGNTRDIREHSWLFKQLTEEPMRVLRVFVTPDKLTEAKKILGEIRKRGAGNE